MVKSISIQNACDGILKFDADLMKFTSESSGNQAVLFMEQNACKFVIFNEDNEPISSVLDAEELDFSDIASQISIPFKFKTSDGW
ncbi:MAG: hypothetical protein MIO93_11070 [ANME-2 cluster archaeon]|jgi:hypothetical protein|nr:hypothetical protein [ANME-2 cluster archaeon]